MSSTRNAEDYSDQWETPLWTTRRLLEEVYLPPGSWLEPMAGDGHIIQALYEDQPDSFQVTAVELRESCAVYLRDNPNVVHAYTADFLKWNAREHRGPSDLCSSSSYFTGAIMNPSFPLTMEVLSKCLTICDQVFMLQRVNWLGSGTKNGKNDFLRSLMPDIYVLPDRVKFMIDGKFPKDDNGHTKSGDSIEYAWFHWGPKETRRRGNGLIRMLAATALEERRAG